MHGELMISLYKYYVVYPGEVVGGLCGVGGGDVCSELLPYITSGIRGNLERDGGETDQNPHLTQKPTYSPTSSSSSSSVSSSASRPREERV